MLLYLCFFLFFGSVMYGKIRNCLKGVYMGTKNSKMCTLAIYLCLVLLYSLDLF